MLISLLYLALTKIAAKQLMNANPEELRHLFHTLTRAAAKTSWAPVAFGLGVGVLVGAGAAVLLAPRAGSETRAALLQSLRDRLNAMGVKLPEPGQSESATPSESAPAPANANGGVAQA